ncbi:asparagine synthase (glutamine-hydrolyzing) [Apilactobacillus timberlakei]|uniref:asparagine synthase (glutamine-hydrolyzing) n=1 Tax=Apilactobacillus timberlakei TaxID=2008380 RepID=UPI0011283091|nr:asparagine synthase (glutamine-hydrolyzing) [Apilactobacillus timberlakei]TPR19307.1 asparagine synthase (glutamine-hydrolyzing) [Apilactobacillus timberlakei]
MCGFCGYVNQSNISSDTIEKMSDRIKHRGPDDEQYFQDDNISMGFRRLSIIDLAHGGQPLFSKDKKKVLTFNGEIYNYKEIRTELKHMGYEFKTDVDSEVLIHGYEAWGTKLLKKLRGMYAFVIYDQENKKIFGARDHFGIKPLYYYDDGESFMYGSEIKSFLSNPNFNKELNIGLLPIHLSFEFIPSKETMFKNVYKVMPGTYFIHDIDSKVTETHRYYKFNYDHIDENQTIDEDAKKIDQIVKDAVKDHVIADVEVGSFLSSGVDSSYVLNEVSKFQPIKTFSLGFNNSKYSELKWSSSFAKQIGQENTPVKIDDNDYFNILPTMMYYMDEPLSNPSAVQLYYLSKATRKQVKVALSGEGADEFFGGYNTYLEAKPFERYQKYVPRFIRKLLSKMVINLPRFHGRRFLIRGAQPLSERYYRVNYVFYYNDRNRLLKNSKINRDAGAYTKHIFDEVKDKDEVTQMQYFDINTWLPFDILQKADRMSMANSLEVRTPLVDKDVAAFASTMPLHTRINSEKTKIAFRKAAENALPERVAMKEKLGFPSPVASWIKQPKFHERIVHAFNCDIAQKFFDTKELMRILKEHDSGKSSMQKIMTPYLFILWYGVYFPENTIEIFNEKVV